MLLNIQDSKNDEQLEKLQKNITIDRNWAIKRQMKFNIANSKINYILKISDFTYMIVGSQLTFSAWELDFRAI